MLRKGDYVFIGIAVFVILFAVVSNIYVSNNESNFHINPAREFGYLIAQLIFYAVIPWLIYNWYSNKKNKKKF